MKKLLVVLGAAVIGLSAFTSAEAAFDGACRNGQKTDAGCIERTITRDFDPKPLGYVAFSKRGCFAALFRTQDDTFALAEVRGLKRYKTGMPVFGPSDAFTALGVHVLKANGKLSIETVEVGLTAPEAVASYIKACE